MSLRLEHSQTDAWRAKRDERDELIDSHAALARSLARRFGHRGEEIDDLVQVAMVGLVKAAHRFDPAMNTQFSTFATATITSDRPATWQPQAASFATGL